MVSSHHPLSDAPPCPADSFFLHLHARWSSVLSKEIRDARSPESMVERLNVYAIECSSSHGFGRWPAVALVVAYTLSSLKNRHYISSISHVHRAITYQFQIFSARNMEAHSGLRGKRTTDFLLRGQLQHSGNHSAF